ncbi:MAG: MFS transporter, partial [Lactobacillus sp.]|nr:MFS transporter [Lactobacillus sp.]
MQEDSYENNHHGYLVLVAWIACMGALCFGFDTGVVNGSLDFLAKPSQLNLSSFEQGVVSSGLTFGAAFGAVFGSPLSDKMGRKKLMIWLGVLFTLTGLGCGFAPNTGVLIILRIIMGLAVGATSALVPVYLAEISPAKERGKFVSMNQLLIVGGQGLSFLINAILGNTIGVHNAGV